MYSFYDMMEMGGTNNPGFKALPDFVQAKILSNMGYGGQPHMMPSYEEGGEPNGGMALGQMAAVADKMSKLRQFVSPDQNLDPWIASKLAVMDDSADAIANYMMYNPEGEEEGVEQEDMEEMMANGGYVVTRSNDRKGKTHKVTGPDGTVKYFGDSKLGQHPKDPERKKAFYARHKKNLENNPFFRAFARKTWKEGGSTFSGNAWYQDGGEPQLEDYPDYGSWRAASYAYNAGQGEQAPQAAMQQEQKVMWHPEWEDQNVDPEMQNSPRTITPASASTANVAPTTVAPKIDYSGVSIVDLLESTGKASDYNSRKQLAEQLGISGYYGSAKQNLELIKKITSNPTVLNDYKPVASPSKPRSKTKAATTASTPASTGLPAGFTYGPGYVAPTNSDSEFLATIQNDFNNRANITNVLKNMANNPAYQNSNQVDSEDEERNRVIDERKRAAAARNIGDEGEFTFPNGKTKKFKDMTWREQMYVAGKNLGNLQSENKSDYINPLAWVGNMSESLGTSFYDAKEKNSIMPYVVGFGKPLAAGAAARLLGPRVSYYPLAKGLPQAAVRALPQAAKALPRAVPTNWVSASGMAFDMGGTFPMEQYKQGGINLDPAKKGTFKAQATRMGMGVQEAASAILNAPEGKYSPAMRKKANFAKNFAKQMGGPVEGEVLDVSPEQLDMLRQQGYQFEIM